MKLRRSPRNSLLFAGMMGMLFFFSLPARSQCNADFTFKSVPPDNGSDTGKIEVSVQDPAPGTYTFTVYEMSGDITFVQTRQTSNPDKITFESLKPATYFVKVEWGQSCHRTLGGFDGIIITEKDQGR